MNAAVRQICCCSWKGDVRVREDAMCAVHGVDQDAKTRRQLRGEISATAEGLRHLRANARDAVHRYQRAKRALADLRVRLALEDDEIRAVVKPPAPGPHALNNARQAAMLVESDREAT